jgi:hypothetical protein
VDERGRAVVLAWQQTIDAAWQAALGQLAGAPPGGQSEAAAGADDLTRHVRSDWAGREILGRYLSGGDDWTIVDDPDWSRYMMDNRLLRDQLYCPMQTQAQNALRQYLWAGVPDGRFDQQLAAEIDSGEGIVGYKYLHGTNEHLGGFEFGGDTRVQPRPDGGYEVTIDGEYTWNDRMDPNPAYRTDQWKDRVAEAITLGQADPYDLHITWHASTRVIFDESGNVVAVEGYPAD